MQGSFTGARQTPPMAARWKWRQPLPPDLADASSEDDPLVALGPDLLGLIMEFLDARSVARCAAVSRGWNLLAAADRLWEPMLSRCSIELCKELVVGKVHIPRMSYSRESSKLRSYSMSLMDGKRERITAKDLCGHVWEYRFLDSAPEYWKSLDPSWKSSGPPMRRYFHSDGTHTADPDDEVWGGHECKYCIVTSYTGDGLIRAHYVRINRWPLMVVMRRDDWGWEMSNDLYRYSSVPDTEKVGGTGPAYFPVW